MNEVTTSGEDSALNKVLTIAHALFTRAQDDAELAALLLKMPHEIIEKLAMCRVPNGLEISAMRDEDGTLQMTASLDPDFDGEIDDAVLERIAGGGATGQAPT